MDRWFYFKASCVAAVALLALWLLVPSVYYFRLPEDARNQRDKLEAVLPSWAPGAQLHLNLGLDLQGGVHLVLNVDTATALAARMARQADEVVRWAEQEQHLTGVRAVAQGQEVRVTAATAEDLVSLRHGAADYFQNLHIVGSDATSITLGLKEDYAAKLRSDAVDQALRVIENRVNRWGVTEPVITRRGESDILVQLPGFKDPERAKELLGKTAQLEFKLVDDENPYFADIAEEQGLPNGIELQEDAYETPGGHLVRSPYLVAAGENGRQALEEYLRAVQQTPGAGVPPGHEVGYECIPSKTKKSACDAYRTYLLQCRPGSGANECLAPITGENISDARVLMDQRRGVGEPYVALTFDRQGGEEFAQLTGSNVGKRLAIVLDKAVTSAPVIQEAIPNGNASITLGATKSYQEMVSEANDLALVLKAGALPAPVVIGEERTVGASLGPELIQRGALAVVTGLFLVALFMAVYYKASGLIADIALALNGLLTLAAMALFNATLTLPGIAGFVLTLGMAVDANVLINERIKEELRRGSNLRLALRLGYSRAFPTIFDAHVTTLIAGVVLFQYGSGPVRGFAVMLIIGLLASLFTSIVVARVIMDWLVIGRGWKSLSV